MIALNMCYSTLLGFSKSKVENGEVSMGFTENIVDIENLTNKDIIATFNGSYFVREEIFKGIIP